MLPIRTTLDDILAVCTYVAKKPTGVSISDARKVLDSKYLDGRKLTALKGWGLIEDQADGRLKITEEGRKVARGPDDFSGVLLKVIATTNAYRAIAERVMHRGEDSISATDVAAHWHEHFNGEAADSDKILNDQAVCFFQLAQGAGLGSLVVGRRGGATRFQFDEENLRRLVDGDSPGMVMEDKPLPAVNVDEELEIEEKSKPELQKGEQLGQAIFIAHGKNKKPLEQLKHILEQFKIPFKVAIDEPNLGRPIGTKVKEIMQGCNCAILIFSADEEFRNTAGNSVWRPSENVVYELGATGYLYGSRLVIMKEDSVDFPTNFRDLGYISFAKDQLDAKAMDVLKELIGFGIVKVST